MTEELFESIGSAAIGTGPLRVPSWCASASPNVSAGAARFRYFP